MFPHLWFRKLYPFIAAVSLCACHSKPVTPGATPIKADGQALTSRGENSEPSFSPDGQKIIYVSASRLRHKQGQVYELDLKSHKERRITFQGAASHWPVYNSKGDYIMYASATDELKENPPMLHVKIDDHFLGPAVYEEPTELYLHHLRGLDMRRLTRHAGFDGEAKFMSPNKIIFTTRTAKGLSIVKGSLHEKWATSLKGQGLRSAFPASWGDGQRIAWIEYSEDYKTSDLKIKEGKEVKTLLGDIQALKKDLAWKPDGNILVFSMNYPNPKESEIYAIKKDGTCLTALTNDHVISEDPSVSPSGDAFLFVSNQSGSKQVYIKSFPKDLNCAPPSIQKPAPPAIQKSPGGSPQSPAPQPEHEPQPPRGQSESA